MEIITLSKSRNFQVPSESIARHQITAFYSSKYCLSQITSTTKSMSSIIPMHIFSPFLRAHHSQSSPPNKPYIKSTQTTSNSQIKPTPNPQRKKKKQQNQRPALLCASRAYRAATQRALWRARARAAKEHSRTIAAQACAAARPRSNPIIVRARARSAASRRG